MIVECSGLEKANCEYSEKVKVQGGVAGDKALFNVGWRVDELTRLNEAGRSMLKLGA